MHSPRLAVLFALLVSASAYSQATPDHPYYSRLNTFGIFGEYSNNSSHIFLGLSQNRKLFTFGGTYTRRVLLNHIVDGQYMLELEPIMVESDPLYTFTTTITSPPPVQIFTNEMTFAEACKPFSESFTYTANGVTYSSTQTVTCDQRQWTFGEGISPLGFKWNFLPHHRIQPVATILGGYMFATRPIPTSDASAANFTFSFGAGFEWYRSQTRSIRAEYRYHHLSNAGTAYDPGIDSQIIQITYAFGH